MIKLTINEFKNLDNFIKLQQKFNCEHFLYKEHEEFIPYPKAELIEEEFYIEIQIPEEFSEDGYLISTTREKLYFYRDFLTNQIKYLAEDYIHDFHNKIRRELEEIEFSILGERAESKEEKRKLTLLQQKVNKSIDNTIFEIKAIIQNIGDFKFLPTDLFNLLNIQFTDILKAISDPQLKSNKAFHIGKLCFDNFTSFDVAVLFYYLREQGVFKYENQANLARFIENNFCLRNNDEYSMIVKAEDYLSELANIRITRNNSLTKIKKIFEDAC